MRSNIVNQHSTYSWAINSQLCIQPMNGPAINIQLGVTDISFLMFFVCLSVRPSVRASICLVLCALSISWMAWKIVSKWAHKFIVLRRREERMFDPSGVKVNVIFQGQTCFWTAEGTVKNLAPMFRMMRRCAERMFNRVLFKVKVAFHYQARTFKRLKGLSYV